MRPSFLVLFLSVLTLGLSSCGLIGGGGDEPAAEAPPPEPVAAVPQTTPPEGTDTEGTEGEAPAEVFPEEEEPEAQEPPAPPPPQSTLEQSTNVEDRVQSVSNTTGQKDPFNPPGIIITGGSENGGADNGGPAGGIPPIIVEASPPPTPPTPPNNAGGGSDNEAVAPAIPTIAPLSIPELPQVEPPPNLGIDPRFQPVVPQVPFNPGPPPPNTARAVEVSAVVQVGQVVKAIVKSPGEETRYVGVGEYIGGGSVYVKNIDVYSPAEPVVVLEEYGQEVTRAVGAAPLPEIAMPEPPTAGGDTGDTIIKGIKISGLMLNGSSISGRVINTTDKPVLVRMIRIRLEGTDGTLISETSLSGPSASLRPGQQGFIDGGVVNTRGYPPEQIRVEIQDIEVEEAE
ncbi:hypothetical protein PN466_11620 [Roseofilum reptotaenium CS-1145]|uniref:DUF5666 domain-containing protein n=1 Tax=Roseofilum reptotaenium AO1-A TaxID=1925591 RepID=A0A1L9QNP0_9CYAN|nr:hypothetical protein [Roseofilum reptotaenium]MDB9517596.1 hypothetical protein [Roseofilum reptotaenium CS-1145]OJJ24284.1 hypothetical protein BI308_17570 [Roseofilum reptotaenium AO1-A]